MSSIILIHKETSSFQKILEGEKGSLEVESQRCNPNLLLQRFKRKNYPNPGVKGGRLGGEEGARMQQHSARSKEAGDPASQPPGSQHPPSILLAPGSL